MQLFHVFQYVFFCKQFIIVLNTKNYKTLWFKYVIWMLWNIQYKLASFNQSIVTLNILQVTFYVIKINGSFVNKNIVVPVSVMANYS